MLTAQPSTYDMFGLIELYGRNYRVYVSLATCPVTGRMYHYPYIAGLQPPTPLFAPPCSRFIIVKILPWSEMLVLLLEM